MRAKINLNQVASKLPSRKLTYSHHGKRKIIHSKVPNGRAYASPLEGKPFFHAKCLLFKKKQVFRQMSESQNPEKTIWDFSLDRWALSVQTHSKMLCFDLKIVSLGLQYVGGGNPETPWTLRVDPMFKCREHHKNVPTCCSHNENQYVGKEWQIEDETYIHIVIIINLVPRNPKNNQKLRSEPCYFCFVVLLHRGSAPLWWRTALQLCSPIPESGNGGKKPTVSKQQLSR